MRSRCQSSSKEKKKIPSISYVTKYVVILKAPTHTGLFLSIFQTPRCSHKFITIQKPKLPFPVAESCPLPSALPLPSHVHLGYRNRTRPSSTRIPFAQTDSFPARGNQLAARSDFGSILAQLLLSFTGRELESACSASEMFMSYRKHCSARLVYVIPRCSELSNSQGAEQRSRACHEMDIIPITPHLLLRLRYPSSPPLPPVNSCTRM